MASAGSTLSENSGMDSLKTTNFLSINSKDSGVMNHGTANGSHRLESREDNFENFSSSYVHRYSNVGEDSKDKDPFGTSSNLQSASSKASNHVVENPSGTSHLLKLCASANTQLASRIEGHSHHRSKSENYGIQSQGAIYFPYDLAIIRENIRCTRILELRGPIGCWLSRSTVMVGLAGQGPIC